MKSDFPRMTKVDIRINTGKSNTFDLAFRKPAWAESVEILLKGKRVTPHEKDGYLHVKRRWEGTSDIHVRFVSGYRVISWPLKNPVGVGVFDGPLCLGLADDRADADATWTLVTDRAGVLQLDPAGRPLVMDSTGARLPLLEPVGSRWLTPDVQDPVQRKILFKSSVLIH